MSETILTGIEPTIARAWGLARNPDLDLDAGVNMGLYEYPTLNHTCGAELLAPPSPMIDNHPAMVPGREGDPSARPVVQGHPT